MNRFCLLVAFYLLSCSVIKAQGVDYKNSVRVGIDYMSLDAPDDLGLRYLARYARHLINDRIVLESSLGFLTIENRRLVLSNIYFEGRPRQRMTADLTVSFDFLPSSRHGLRLGGGPSLWYRKDDILREASFTVSPNSPGGSWAILSDKVDEVNFGYHIAAEYEYRIGSRTTLAGRIGMANLNRAGISTTGGLNVGYRF